MKLTYRGLSYDYNPPTVNVEDANVAGKYRGLDWRFRNLKKPPVIVPRHNLKYRGVTYNVAESAAVQNAEPVKLPSLSTQEKARNLMMARHRETENRQRSMLNRLAEEVGLVAH